MRRRINEKNDAVSILNSDLVKLAIIGCIAIVVALLFMSITSMAIIFPGK